MENELIEFESRHAIFNYRWSSTDKLFKECQYAILFSKKEQLLMEIWKAGQRRLFLLNLKGKYAGMLAIANL